MRKLLVRKKHKGMYKHTFKTANERKFSKEEGTAETNDHYGVAFFIFTLAF